MALTERWPTVAAAIIRDPTLIGRLEQAASQKSLAIRPEQITAIEDEIGITGLDSSLMDFLRRADPLGNVARFLVNFSLETDE